MKIQFLAYITFIILYIWICYFDSLFQENNNISENLRLVGKKIYEEKFYAKEIYIKSVFDISASILGD